MRVMGLLSRGLRPKGHDTHSLVFLFFVLINFSSTFNLLKVDFFTLEVITLNYQKHYHHLTKLNKYNFNYDEIKSSL